jgi:hypothetical protein
METNQMTGIRISKGYLFAFLLFVLLLFLALFYHAFLFDFFIGPLAQAFWVIVRVFLSVDQIIFWLGLIIVLLLMTFRLIPIRVGASSKYQYIDPQTSSNRVEYWRSIFQPPHNPTRKAVVKENLLKLIEALPQSANGELKGFFNTEKRRFINFRSPNYYNSIEQVLQLLETSLEIEYHDSTN